MLRRSLLKPLLAAPPGTKKVFVVAGLGGHVLKFRPLAALLGNWQLIGILYPMFAGSKKDYTTIKSLALDMLPACDDCHDPIVLLGHSMGGAVAYDMACELEKRGRTAIVVMIDTSVPALRKRYGLLFRGLRKFFVIIPLRLLGRRKWPHRRRRTSDAVNVRKFIADGRAAHRKYKPPHSKVRVVFVRAVPEDKFAWFWKGYWPSHDYGWSKVAKVSDILSCPGTHGAVVQRPYLAGLAEVLDEAFDRIYSDTPNA
jgi:thioesterase domain-containing protein